MQVSLPLVFRSVSIATIYSGVSGDSTMGVIGFVGCACLRELRLLVPFGLFEAQRGRRGMAVGIGYCRGGAGASCRKMMPSSSPEKSSGKRSASLMNALGTVPLNAPRDLPAGQLG